MRTLRTLGIYASFVILVLILGLLAGWYLYLRKETQNTSAADSARGYNTSAPEGTINGSTYANINSMTGSSSPATQKSAPAKSRGFIAGIISWMTGKNAGITDTSSNASGPAPSFGVNAPLPTSTMPVKKLPRLWQIAKTPTAGFGFVTASGKLSIYFAERATGYIFAADPETGAVSRLTNKLIPKIYEAYFSRTGAPIFRAIEGGYATTFSGKISTSSAATSTTYSLSLVQSEKNIRALSVEPATGRIFATEVGTSTLGEVSQWDGTKAKQVFSSNVGSWRPYLLPDGRMFIAESAEDFISGYAYEIKKGGTLMPLVRDVPGLTILPQSSSTALLYGTSENSLGLFAIASAGASPVELSIKTTADKCAWGSAKGIAYCAVPISDPGPGYLGAWYRGSVHTRDVWWSIDAGAGSAKKLFAANDSAQQADAISPAIDPSGRYIVYLDNRDKSLWMLRIVE
ncbi:hypothetical protein HY968_03845 [Candidatus Kaiserbacteria bacterium]|nr:hypothetical protein [Candidatus Kaiserbacteria bacterium]